MKPSTNCQAYVHQLDDTVRLDDLIDFTVMNHHTETNNDDDENPDYGNGTLLAYMAGRNNSNSAGIRNVLAAKSTTDKNKD